MNAYRKAVESHQIEVVGEKLRSMMSWLKGKKIV
jgi:ketol-acid reductoisomerase